MAPLDQIELIETIAYADASAGWCTSILSDSGFYAGFLEDAPSRKLFPNLDARCAGMLAPIGRAEVVPGGYRVSGHWSFGSGSSHATHITGGCLIMKDGQPLLDASGLPRWRVMIFNPTDVKIEDTWHTTGLAGSGSNDYHVTEAFVPYEHTFYILDEPARSEPLYRYHGFFFANVPGVPFGIARAALDEAREIVGSKRSFPAHVLLRDDAQVQIDFGEAEALLAALRAFVTDAIGNLWRSLESGDTPTLKQRAALGLCIVHAGRSAQRIVDLACGIVGSAALYRKCRLERLRRDMIAVNSHVVHNRKTYGAARRILLGADEALSFF